MSPFVILERMTLNYSFIFYKHSVSADRTVLIKGR